MGRTAVVAAEKTPTKKATKTYHNAAPEPHKYNANTLNGTQREGEKTKERPEKTRPCGGHGGAKAETFVTRTKSATWEN